MTEEHDDALEQDDTLDQADTDAAPEHEPYTGDEEFEDELAADSGEVDTAALMAEAYDDQLRMKASWHLIPRENFVFLFANCLFFAGALCAWSRMIPPDWLEAAGKARVELDPSTYLMGLDTIRGTFIFALAMYGFFQVVFNIVGRTTKVWPFMLNALVALEVGIGGLSRGFGSEAMDMASTYLENAESKTLMDDMMVPLSAVPPAYWMLTLGGMIVLIVILNGIMTGAKKAKMAAAEEGASRRRR